MLKINWKEDLSLKTVDVEKLRQGDAYDYLQEHRTAGYTVEELNEAANFEYRDCPCCFSSSFDHVHTKDGCDLVRCSSCNVVYVNPIFKSQKYYEIYNADEYETVVQKVNHRSHAYRVERFGRERVEFFEKYHAPDLPKTYLDIGCNTGFVVEAAVASGWDAVGVELNKGAVSFARSRGLTIFDQPMENINFDQQFSVISLFDVLEHLVEPKKIIDISRALLAPKGMLYLYVPNLASASVDFLGYEDSHFIWPTHHLTYFTPPTLKSFIEKAGFELVFWETDGLDIIDVVWRFKRDGATDTEILANQADRIQKYINAAGHGKNLRMFFRKSN